MSKIRKINVSEVSGNQNNNIFPPGTLWLDRNNNLRISDGVTEGGSDLIGAVKDVTYSTLQTLIDNDELIPSYHYRITDFMTCYDQPDFNCFGNSITEDNYKTSAVLPIIVTALSENELAPEAFQPAYPKDRIMYDVTWNQTEVTSGTARGRITERIDEYGNRTDYDHRAILFKRYQYVEIDFANPENGLVNVASTSDTQMTVTGTDTNFTSLAAGQYIGFDNGNDFRSYEITSITSDTEMSIEGRSNLNTNNLKMFRSYIRNYTSYYMNNLLSDSTFQENYTFDFEYTCKNNYIGNVANLYSWDELPFLLANNVFNGGHHVNNQFANGCYNNTFGQNSDNNSVGNYFYNNIIPFQFDENLIGNYFNNNKIGGSFQYNHIGEYFYTNYSVDSGFYGNKVMSYFNNNKWAGNDFYNNEIDNLFNNNKIRGGFYGNSVGYNYSYNTHENDAYNNWIGIEVKGNLFYQQFGGNNVSSYNTGNTFFANTYSNVMGQFTLDNDFNGSLARNSWGEGFYGNSIGSDFNDNQIGSNFYSNTIGDFFYGNRIQSYFYGNTIGDNFGYGYNATQGNVIGNYFIENTVGEYFYNNTIADNFVDNTVGDYFQLNNVKFGVASTNFDQYRGGIQTISWTGTAAGGVNTYTDVAGTTLGSGIGATFDVTVSAINPVVSGGGTTHVLNPNSDPGWTGWTTYNYPGAYFIFGGDFQDEVTPQAGWYFVDDNGTIRQVLSSPVWFSGGNPTPIYNGNGWFLVIDGPYTVNDLVTGITFYESLPEVTFDPVYTNVTVNNSGVAYQVNDTVTILGSSLGGVDVDNDVTVTVTSESGTPSVYGYYNCDLFMKSGGASTARLSYFDDNDVLTVKGITE